MKRYALVRVDGRLSPSHFEVETIENIWEMKIIDDVVKEYGDTKEQLIRKVAQVLKRETGNDGIFISDGRNFQDSKSVFWEDVAKEIVEFLGVEE